MSALVATLTSLPYTQFRRSRYFYLYYDAFFLLACLALLATMRATGYVAAVQSWDWRLLVLLPLACHVQILCSVYIHNCTHGNFPRSVNRLIGEICGVVVLTRFASWEIIHQRHHKYPDDPTDDPHPLTAETAGYWPYLVRTVVGVEEQLQKLFYERFGDTPENRRFQRLRAVVSFGTMVVLALTWHQALGPVLFWMLFVPAAVVGFFHLIHFNWSTHNPYSPEGDYRPVNLNNGYYRIGNWLWHGIYWHGNHHEKSGLFNPSKMPADKALPVIVHGDSTAHYPRTKAKKRRAA